MNNTCYYKNDKSKKDGFFPYCKQCTMEKSYLYQYENTEQYLKKHRAYDRNTYHTVPGMKEKRSLHGQKKRDSGYEILWRKNNKDKIKQYGDKYKTKAHKITKKEWDSCLEYFNNTCAYCGMTLEDHKEKFNQQFHKEHVSDCGRNDLKNCIPSCKSCNSKKHTTSFNDWYSPKNEIYSKERYSKICKWIKEDCKLYLHKKKVIAA
jgi:hypothetical protein